VVIAFYFRKEISWFFKGWMFLEQLSKHQLIKKELFAYIFTTRKISNLLPVLNPLVRLGPSCRPNLHDRLRSLHLLLSGSANDDGSEGGSEVAKTTITFVMSVRLSAWNNSALTK
jgi:hypothetical protein